MVCAIIEREEEMLQVFKITFWNVMEEADE